ncbi:MAG TPA: hypothetical protein VNS61_13990 [Caldimonas sp.]|nr:hypothetical protein [Caldimonas sp.]
MLRLVALAILVANLLFFGYARGWFDGVFGLRSIGDREPERIASQVRPASIVLMPMLAASATGGVARTCLEAGPIAAADAASAEATLKGMLPPGGWIDIRNETAGPTTTSVTHTYRVSVADATTAARLTALKLDASGRSFSACAKTSEAVR